MRSTRLDQTGQPWRVAVNVQSEDKSDVVYRAAWIGLLKTEGA